MVDNSHAPTLRLLCALGVRFILCKFDSLDNICEVLKKTTLKKYMSSYLKSVFVKYPPPPRWAKEGGEVNDEELFTKRESDIILDLFQGISPWNVAKKRFISIKTVSAHKLNALKKIRMRNLNEMFITTSKKI